MNIDRREFLVGALAACAAHKVAPVVKPPPRLTILILGGTGFLGPHVVTAARARGHTLTLFNRGKTHPGLFPDIEKLQGDRDGHLEPLAGRKWDAVVDTSGYVPRIVKASAELLAPNIKQYVFISTISVYKGLGKVGADESAPLETMPDPSNEEVRKYYGALKALCEQAAEAAMPGRVANLRPGLIIGPGDPTGRFTHWPTRIADGGEVLAPGDGSTPVQYIDGRDLGEWIVTVIENTVVGTYNALGPAKPITMKQVLDACNAVAGNKATLTWVDAKFLDEHKVTGWQDMPMWLDPSGEDAGFGTMSNARAVAKGLTFRPIADTAKDTLAWVASLPAEQAAKVRSSGISREREAEVLAAWKSRK